MVKKMLKWKKWTLFGVMVFYAVILTAWVTSDGCVGSEAVCVVLTEMQCPNFWQNDSGVSYQCSWNLTEMTCEWGDICDGATSSSSSSTTTTTTTTTTTMPNNAKFFVENETQYVFQVDSGTGWTNISNSLWVYGDIHYQGSLESFSPIRFGKDRDVGYTRLCVHDKNRGQTGIWWHNGIMITQTHADWCRESKRRSIIRRMVYKVMRILRR